VVHSRYWRSDHFTVEFTYYFEVQAPPEWKDAFLKKHSLALVSPLTARSFRTDNHSDDTPNWFAPDQIDSYDVWDKAGYYGGLDKQDQRTHLLLRLAALTALRK
jgi:hypothetical protein